MSKLEEVAAVLRGEEPKAAEVQPDEPRLEEETGADEAPEQPAQPEAKLERQTVRTLAEKLGVKPSDLYDLIDIGLPNDKVYSLGQLKDLAFEGLGATKAKTQLDKDATELMVQRRELQMVGQKLAETGRITQAEVDAMRQTEEKRLAAEMQNFRRSVPSWDDPVTRSREIEAISAYSRKYGISIPEFESMVTDARLMKLVRDAAISQPEPVPAVQPRRAPAAAQKPSGNNRRDQVAQISALLRG